MPPFLLTWVGGVMGLVALFILVYARAALRPSNCLLKFNIERILDLAEKGNIVEATALAKLKYGYDLKQAKKFVEELT